MSAFGALDRGTRVATLLLGGAAAAGVGYLGWQMARPAPEPTEAAAVASETTSETAPTNPEPAAETAAAPEPMTEPTTETPTDTAPPAPPVIDTWRVTAEGEAVVSGSAEPGATVEVMVDGTAVGKGEAAGSGEFAILFTLAPNPKPSLMWLSMILPDQPKIDSEEMVALGPIEGPKLAAAEPEAAPEEDQIAAAEDPAAPPALLLSEEGAVVLQDPAAPEPAAVSTTVMIDTIAYTPEGEVQVGGRAAAGAGLRLYLDNAEKLTLQVPATGLWVTTLPDTAPGVYTLRVDQLDAAGKVTSRFETPFKRETLEALAAVSEVADEPAPGGEEMVASVESEAQTPVAAVQGETPTEVAAAEPTETPEPAAAAEPAALETATAEPAATEFATPETAASPEAPALAQSDPVAAAPTPVTVTVQPGFTLWGIAQERWGDGVLYVQVFEANKDKIKDPDLIYPGQVFSMPEPAAP
jgi:nucleoid-associated protein YgaU